MVPNINKGAHIISCTKGIKLDPFRSMSDIISKNINTNIITVGVLSGPNLAREIAENKVAGTVIASIAKSLLMMLKKFFPQNTFKIYSSDDVQGVELAGALKNIYAIICGMADSWKLEKMLLD